MGALLGYAIGHVFWEAVGQPIVAFYNGEAAFDRFVVFYDDWGIWIVLAAAISFLPFKVATIASGVSGLALVPFLITSLIGAPFDFSALPRLSIISAPIFKNSSTAISIFFRCFLSLCWSWLLAY